MAGELEQQLMAREMAQPSQGPVGMSNNPIAMLMRMLQGSGQDIELPAESGIIDPKLQAVTPMDQLMKVFKTANQYSSGTGSPIERLQKAGR